ncbi:ParB/RepB/Spo0J family partition protein [Enterobacter wuhouensis]|uniref:ParB/RepB/Spo0J family partition protein n=1 Tax=Enterobacter wuhouensis TaxID=2529381 RepID=UPI002FD66232
MSVAESKAKNAKKASQKKADNVQTLAPEVLKSILDATPVEYVKVKELVISDLNARTIPYSKESVRGLAESIAAIGLLQNLVVHSMPDNLSGVACGGRRTTALELLLDEKRIQPDDVVPVKRVSREVAAAASVAENEQRAAMHPAEQITGFRTLAEMGKTPAQIGDELGFGFRHVQRMLKLSGLAPSLLKLLAEDQLTVEQCQALSLENDQTRQVAVYESVKEEYGHTPAAALKKRITESEISVSHPRFVFIGRDTYETAGGVVREDLFSEEEGDGTVDGLLVERLVQEKLALIAQDIYQKEGWTWSDGRLSPISLYGADGQEYRILPEPDAIYNEEDSRRIDELSDQYNALDPDSDEAEAISSEITLIEHVAELRGWTEEMKAKSGVVVSLKNGALYVQRGICRKADLPEVTREEKDSPASGVTHISSPDAAEGISVPLLTKMSSERTLAVQAALMQQPEKAVALMVWRMCASVFSGSCQNNPFDLRVDVSHYALTNEAPSGKTGKAFTALMQEKDRLEALLPEGWRKDFTTFFALDGVLLMSLMAFCTACSINAVQTRDMGRTSRSRLDALETAITFHLRDWWEPTKAGYFSSLKHDQIVRSLTDAGLTGAAMDAAKMKKGDAAEHAEFHLRNTRWVPDWLRAPEPEAATENTDTDNTTLAA